MLRRLPPRLWPRRALESQCGLSPKLGERGLEEYGSSASSPTALSRRRSMPPLRLGDGSGAAGGDGGERVGARLSMAAQTEMCGSARSAVRCATGLGAKLREGGRWVAARRACEQIGRMKRVLALRPYGPLPGVYQLAALQEQVMRMQ